MDHRADAWAYLRQGLLNQQINICSHNVVLGNSMTNVKICMLCKKHILNGYFMNVEVKTSAEWKR